MLETVIAVGAIIGLGMFVVAVGLLLLLIIILLGSILFDALQEINVR